MWLKAQIIAAAVLCCGAALLPGQTRLSIEQASSRQSPTYAPVYLDQIVITEGVVAADSIQVQDYAHTSLQDSKGRGIMIETQPGQFRELKPGNYIEVTGLILNREGQPVLAPSEVRLLRQVNPPAPQSIAIEKLRDVRYVARFATIEGRIFRAGGNTGGDSIQVGNEESSIQVFLPQTARGGSEGLEHLSVGDRVRVVGVTSQYCPKAPYNRYFELVVDHPSGVTVLERDWLISPRTIAYLIAVIAAGLILWWYRERRQARLRFILRGLYSLGEELIAAQTPVEVLERLRSSLSKITQSSVVQMYLYRSESKTLERVQAGPPEPDSSILIDAPATALGNAVALAFRNQTLLHIPDTRRSALWKGRPDQAEAPKSAVYIPMIAKNEVLGVLEISRRERVRPFGVDEQSGMQHLGNQIAVALRLQEQHTVREQLFRSEKLAASGHLISGVADQLREPLDTIAGAANDALSYPVESVVQELLRDVVYASRRATSIVSRLVSFTRSDAAEVRRFELHRVLSGLLQFRQQEWRTRRIQVEREFTSEHISVAAAQGQLEQVFLNLLIYAEQAVENSTHRTITVSTLTIAKRVIIEISFPYQGAAQPAPNPLHRNDSSDALDLGVCRTLIQGQSGELRFVQTRPDLCRFEVELPLMSGTRPERIPGASTELRPMTILVVDPDESFQRELLTMLGGRGHRVVPVASGEEAIELAQRLRFDLAFAAVRLPGFSWVELFEQIRDEIGGFVLVTTGYDADLARVVQAGDGYLLSRPIDEVELDSLLETAAQRLSSRVMPRAGA